MGNDTQINNDYKDLVIDAHDYNKDLSGWEKIYDYSYVRNEELYSNFAAQYPGLDPTNTSIPYEDDFKEYCNVYYNDELNQYFVSGNFTYRSEEGYTGKEEAFMAFLPENNSSIDTFVNKFSGAGSMTEDEREIIHDYMTEKLDDGQAVYVTHSSSLNADRSYHFFDKTKYTTSEGGIVQISSQNENVITILERKLGIVNAGFSGGAVAAYKANMYQLKNNDGDYTYLALPDPGAIRSTGPLFDLNNPQDVENAKLLSNSTVVVFTRFNSTLEGGKYMAGSENEIGSGWRDREDYKIIASNCKDFIIFEAKEDSTIKTEHVAQNNLFNKNVANYGSIINNEYDLSRYNMYKPIVDPETGEVTYELIESDEERRKIINYLTMKDKLYQENPVFMNKYSDLQTKISELRIFCKNFVDNATAELETMSSNNSSIMNSATIGAYRSTASTIRYSDLIIAKEYYTQLGVLINTIDSTISFIDYMGEEKEQQEKQLTEESEKLVA